VNRCLLILLFIIAVIQEIPHSIVHRDNYKSMRVMTMMMMIAVMMVVMMMRMMMLMMMMMTVVANNSRTCKYRRRQPVASDPPLDIHHRCHS
jgi:uncharacterized membrane protein